MKHDLEVPVALCPVQGLVHRLEDYGVPEGNIYGIQNGLPGFYNHSSKPVSIVPPWQRLASTWVECSNICSLHEFTTKV